MKLRITLVAGDIIKDEHGYWMQYDEPLERGSLVPRRRCVLMDAMTQKEAELEAIEEGFNVIGVIQ